MLWRKGSWQSSFHGQEEEEDDETEVKEKRNVVEEIKQN